MKRSLPPADRRHDGDILCGRLPVLEALLANRRRFTKVLLRSGACDSPEIRRIRDLCAARSIPVVMEQGRELDRLVSDAHHQGVVLLASPYPYVGLNSILSERASRDPVLLLVLDHVVDPQNLGALLRAADGAGVDGVVLPARRAAAVTPAAVRASSGASEHVRVAQVANIAETISRLKEMGIWVAGLEGVEGARACHEVDLTGPIAVVVGSEGGGLSRLVRERCDWLVRIPRYGRVSSLNAAVAGAIALYEVRRQRLARCGHPG